MPSVYLDELEKRSRAYAAALKEAEEHYRYLVSQGVSSERAASRATERGREYFDWLTLKRLEPPTDTYAGWQQD